ncbi:uncharacterized protein LOC123477088 isoform X4 [Daphnia magna]|uniref:uncharacterized protein LOC123477088 isoform X4 n=1 Tax=Daphnia magna TaxID=35525 RepID=UPI001E1BDE58|nr:uncharacterized protein LOC123477088 isoform X4 [Daphnia magna]
MAGSNTSNGKLPKKMSCFICGNIYQDENRRVGLFHVPKKNFSSWKFVLPELLEKSRLCDIHFDKCDVLKGITVGKDFYPYDRWRLLPSAIPKHLLVKQSAAASRTQSRTPLKDIFSVNHTGNQPTNYFPPKKRNSKGSTSISQTPENKIAMDEDEEHSIVGCAIENTPENKIAMDEDEEHSIVGCAIENTPENKIAMDEDEEHSIVGCAIENTPENKIAMDEDEEHSIVGCAIENTPENKIAMDEDEEHSIVGCAIENTPENKIAMDEDEEHSIVGCAIKKSNAPEKNSPKSNFIENDKDGMADFIFKKHTKKKCQIRLPTNCKTCQMEKTGQCSSCAIVELKQQVREKDKQLITAKCYRTRSETHLKCLKLKLKENRKKLNTCRQKLLRMKRYGQEIVETLGNLKEKITTLTANQLDEQIKFLSHGERVIINTFILKGKAELQATSGRSHSMKYDSGFLMQCLLLKLKSSSTYTHLKNNNILPLPSLSTLRRRLSSSECKYGFNFVIFTSPKKERR